MRDVCGRLRRWHAGGAVCQERSRCHAGDDFGGRSLRHAEHGTRVAAAIQDAPILVGAGDIGDCDTPGAAQTAALLDSIPGTVFTTGDNVQGVGDLDEYRRCYEPSWGRHRYRPRPVPGNHDYLTSGANDYFRYFGSQAGSPAHSYYSTRVSGWLLLGLNSEVPVGPNSPQAQWLAQTLRADRTQCVVAMWHQPFISSGPSRGTSRMQHLWEILQEHRVDLVVQGHDHFYERFAPVRADEKIDQANGIRSFIVGTGGGRLMEMVARHPASVARARIWGVLKIYLSPDRYDWEFVSVGGASLDRGRDVCK